VVTEPPCQGCGWTPPLGEALWPSHGALAVKWIEKFCICGEGDFYGQLIKLRNDQKRFLYKWYEYCESCGQWRYKEGLRGAATGDGKTQFIASIVMLEFAGPPEITVKSPNIPVAAASFEQANLLFSAVATMAGGRDNMVKESPLNGLFHVFDTEIRFADGRPGRIFRIAAAAGTNEGGLPTLFVCDELHEWGEPGSNKARVHTVVGKSTNKRRTVRGSGRRLNLSTAGFDVDNSLLGAFYKRGLACKKDPFVDPRYLFDWREAPDGLDYENPEHRTIAARAASGAADVLWNLSDRVAEWRKPDMPRHEWIRYYANSWVDIAEDSWLIDHPAAWGECEGPFRSDDENPFVLAVDMALKRDGCAVVRVEKLPDGKFGITSKSWRPVSGKVDHIEVFQYIRKHARGSGFRGVVYDPRFFEVPARELEDSGILIVEFDQSPIRMAPAVGETYDRILGKELVHDGDPELRTAVKSAAKREQERGFTLSKGKSKRLIDPAVAMCMGVWVLHAMEPAESEILVDWA
jgi:phage terminase large subunit-like protein